MAVGQALKHTNNSLMKINDEQVTDIFRRVVKATGFRIIGRDYLWPT